MSLRLSRGRAIALVAILLLSVAFRGPWARDLTEDATGDQAEYQKLAVSLLNGHGFATETGQPTAYRTPGLPLVLAGLYAVTGVHVRTARVFFAIISVLTPLLIYALALAIAGDDVVAVLAGALWAILLSARHLSGMLLGESIAALLVVAAILAVVKAERRASIPLAAVGGALLGYAVLTRPFLLPVVVVVAGWLVVRRASRPAIALVCAAVLVLAPWVVRNGVALGFWGMTTETAALWLGNNAWARGSWSGDGEQFKDVRERHPGFDAMTEVEQARFFSREAMAEIRNHPGRFLWLLPRKAFNFFNASWDGFFVDRIYLIALPFMALGAWRLGRRGESRHLAALLAAPAFGVLLVCLVAVGHPRFRHAVEPLLMVLAAVGMRALIPRAVETRDPERAWVTS